MCFQVYLSDPSPCQLNTPFRPPPPTNHPLHTHPSVPFPLFERLFSTFVWILSWYNLCIVFYLPKTFNRIVGYKNEKINAWKFVPLNANINFL